MTETFAKSLILVGALITLTGVGLYFVSRSETNLFQWFGQLPLDVKVERENFKLYFPFGTSLALSLLISLFLYLYRKFSE